LLFAYFHFCVTLFLCVSRDRVDRCGCERISVPHIVPLIASGLVVRVPATDPEVPVSNPGVTKIFRNSGSGTRSNQPREDK
jgi:hypothetical protein